MSGSGPFHDNLSLRIEGLVLSRGARILTRNLCLEAKSGAFVELRGGNGAGKTTLLRTIAGFLRPTTGRIVFRGAAEPSLSLHYVGHLNGLKSSASVRSHLRYWSGLFGAALDEEDTLRRVGLLLQADLPARVLSQGQARRLALARLAIAPRPLWLLDEPGAALDVQGKAMLTGMINAHCAVGGIVVAAVHEPIGPAPAHVLVLGE